MFRFHSFSPHYTLYSCLREGEPSFFDYHTSNGLPSVGVAPSTPCDQVFAYCKQKPSSLFAAVMRHNKNLLEQVLRDELAMGMYRWSPGADGEEDTVLVMSDPYTFLNSLSKKHVPQKTTYEILKYTVVATRRPGEKQITLRLNLGHLEGVLKPSFFVVGTPDGTGVKSVRVNYEQNNIQVTDEKGLVFMPPKKIDLETSEPTLVRDLRKKMFLLQAPTKWPVGDRHMLEKIFHLFHKDNQEMNILHTLLSSQSVGNHQSLSEATEEVSKSESVEGGNSAQHSRQYTINKNSTSSSEEEEETGLSFHSEEEEEETGLSFHSEEEEEDEEELPTKSATNTKTTGASESLSSKSTGNSFTQVGETGSGGNISFQPSTSVSLTRQNSHTHQTSSSRSDKSSSVSLTRQNSHTRQASSSRSDKSSSAADSRDSGAMEEPRASSSSYSTSSSSTPTSSEISETKATHASRHTGPTQEVQVENGGLFYDSQKVQALSNLLPCMQGVTNNVFTVTLDLDDHSKKKKGKRKEFQVSIEVLAARQCLEKQAH